MTRHLATLSIYFSNSFFISYPFQLRFMGANQEAHTFPSCGMACTLSALFFFSFQRYAHTLPGSTWAFANLTACWLHTGLPISPGGEWRVSPFQVVSRWFSHNASFFFPLRKKKEVNQSTSRHKPQAEEENDVSPLA